MIGFLHTAHQHIARFDTLLDTRQPSLTRQHVVREDLLEQARAHGPTPELVAQVRDTLQEAAHNAEVVVCTCSSLGQIAETLAAELPVPILRIDRVMAEQAVQQAKELLILVTVESTLEPTRDLFTDAARGRDVNLSLHLCEGAWEQFLQGDMQSYAQKIIETALELTGKHPYDLIVLAQASMDVALEQSTWPALPTVSSPSLVVDAAIAKLPTSST
ncbi:MAG: aspartate/glutamate racemase family protein [Deinococcota bacterium]